MTTRQTLYRFYDANDVLLYVGISMTPWERFRQHRQEKSWWDDIVTIRKEEHDSRPAVMEAEKCAIEAEKPLYNIQHNRKSFVDWDGKTRKGKGKWRASTPEDAPVYTVTSRTGRVHFGEFRLVYEVDLDPISDDYYWDDVDPKQLFREWFKKVDRKHGGKYRGGIVPIYWFVEGPGVFEFAQREQHGLISPRDGFLSYYGKPVTPSGRVVEVHDLPVIRKRWDAGQADKGGFLPVATGWEPHPMQADVDAGWLQHRATRGKQWVISPGPSPSRWENVTNGIALSWASA